MRVREPIVYVNGEFKPQSQATISVFDRVVSYGDGVFDTLVAKNGYVFKVDQHLERLFRSPRKRLSKSQFKVDEDITLFKSVGIAVEDMAAAETIYRIVREKHLGTEIRL